MKKLLEIIIWIICCGFSFVLWGGIQFFLSKRENKIVGLFLPILSSFMILLSILLIVIGFENSRNDILIGGVILCGVSIIVFLGFVLIYIKCRRDKDKNEVVIKDSEKL